MAGNPSEYPLEQEVDTDAYCDKSYDDKKNAQCLGQLCAEMEFLRQKILKRFCRECHVSPFFRRI